MQIEDLTPEQKLSVPSPAAARHRIRFQSKSEKGLDRGPDPFENYKCWTLFWRHEVANADASLSCLHNELH